MNTDRALAFLKIAFLKNGYWKLLSMVITVLIYFSIRAEISHPLTVTVPVEVDSDAASMGAAIESVEPRSVRLTLRGSYSDVNTLDGTQIRCVVRPRPKPTVDSVTVKLRASTLRGVRGGVRVEKIEPPEVVVKFDFPMSLTLPVAPPPVQGRARGRVQLSYDQTSAVVKGSRRLLSPLDAEKTRIQTDAIDVEGRSQSFVVRGVKLFPPGGAVNAVVEPAEMVVNVAIISETASAQVEHVPVIVTQPASSANRWTTEPRWVDIEVTGRSEEVHAVSFDQLVASVNGNVPVTPLSVTNTVPVRILVQQGVQVDDVRAIPPEVRLIPVPAEPAPSVPVPIPVPEAVPNG
ncbi:MAG: hypothetical protein LBW77_02665 [Verrucomicrobiota bacterium]|jgi:hypothetical protein|nr:hypothetical protein [Verrucomicrobiota bacterium]